MLENLIRNVFGLTTIFKKRMALNDQALSEGREKEKKEGLA